MSAYGQEILYFVRFYTHTVQGAEDLTQEVFLRAYRGYEQFRGDSQVKTWLLRIAVNVCKDKYRHNRRHPVAYVDEFPEATSPVDAGRSSDMAPSAEDEAMRRLSHTWLVESVLNLPGHYKDVILLHYFESQSVQEMAKPFRFLLRQSKHGSFEHAKC